MGVDDLILIAPQCELTYAAQQAAATGQSALQNRKTYLSWSEFFQHEPDGLRIAFSARDGKGRMVQNFPEVLNHLAKEDSRWSDSQGEPVIVYLIFGPEDWGLSADDLDQVHLSACLPVYGTNPSLNLAQAVLLALYILRAHWGGSQLSLVQRRDETQFLTPGKTFPEETLKEFLVQLGFQVENRNTSVLTVLQRLLLRTVPTEKELKIFEVIFRQAARKLKERRELKKL